MEYLIRLTIQCIYYLLVMLFLAFFGMSGWNIIAAHHNLISLSFGDAFNLSYILFLVVFVSKGYNFSFFEDVQ